MGISSAVRDAVVDLLNAGLVNFGGVDDGAKPLRSINVAFISGPEQLQEFLERFQSPTPAGILAVPDVDYKPNDSPSFRQTRTTERFRFIWFDSDEAMSKQAGAAINKSAMQDRVLTYEWVRDWIESSFNQAKVTLTGDYKARLINVRSARGIDLPKYAAFVFEFDLDVDGSARAY